MLIVRNGCGKMMPSGEDGQSGLVANHDNVLLFVFCPFILNFPKVSIKLPFKIHTHIYIHI